LKEEQNSDINAMIKSNLMEINTIVQQYKDASTKLSNEQDSLQNLLPKLQNDSAVE